MLFTKLDATAGPSPPAVGLRLLNRRRGKDSPGQLAIFSVRGTHYRCQVEVRLKGKKQNLLYEAHEPGVLLMNRISWPAGWTETQKPNEQPHLHPLLAF